MSSSDVLVLLNPSRLATAYPLADEGSTGIDDRHTILMQDGEGDAFMGSTTVQMNTVPI